MKKIMVLACALGLMGVASAQINPAAMKGVELISKKSDQPLVVNHAGNQMRNDNPVLTDTVLTESTYTNQDGYIGVIAGEMPGGAYNTPYGSYWISHFFGSGEVGYVFNHTKNSYNYTVAQKRLMPGMRLTGAAMLMCRFPGRTDSAEVYFKAYTPDMIKNQKVLADFTAEQLSYQEVNYPCDPELGIASEKTKMPWLGYDGQFPEAILATAEFTNGVYLGEGANEYVAISVVMPADTLYNISMLLNVSANNNPYTSEMKFSVFSVVDWQNQEMWYAEGSTTQEVAREKPSYFENDQQTNPRYSVIGLNAWKLNDGTMPLNGEPQMRACYSYQADIESPNAYDVKVSVSPIPATDVVNVTAFSNIQKVELFNMAGSMVERVNGNGFEATLNVSELNSGVYVAKVYTDNGIATKKIVVR